MGRVELSGIAGSPARWPSAPSNAAWTRTWRALKAPLERRMDARGQM